MFSRARPRRARVEFIEDEIRLVDLSDDASTEGLMWLLGGFGIEAKPESQLKPCFDLEELKLRNQSLRKNSP